VQGQRLATVLAVTLLGFAAAPIGAAAAQAHPLKPLPVHAAGCDPSPCEAAAPTLVEGIEGKADRLPLSNEKGICAIRTACRPPEPAAAALAVQYVEPPAPPEPAQGPRGPAPSAPRSNSVILGVPVYAQIWNLDCETAALQMALAYNGHWYSQPTLFGPQNADLRSPVLDNAGNIVQWGNPYTNFVGNVHGSETAKTGYGVYWPVILNIARTHGAPNSYGGEGLSPQTVYAALAARHPVQIWINYGFTTSPASTWRSWDGRTIRYTLHEHSVTLTGLSDGGVLVNDPWPGNQYWVSKSVFEAAWAVFGNMAVVVQ
jgi:uncharacterized protein YvpB